MDINKIFKIKKKYFINFNFNLGDNLNLKIFDKNKIKDLSGILIKKNFFNFKIFKNFNNFLINKIIFFSEKLKKIKILKKRKIKKKFFIF